MGEGTFLVPACLACFHKAARIIEFKTFDSATRFSSLPSLRLQQTSIMDECPDPPGAQHVVVGPQLNINSGKE